MRPILLLLPATILFVTAAGCGDDDDILSDETRSTLEAGVTNVGGTVQAGATNVGGTVDAGRTTVSGTVQSGATSVGGTVQAGATEVKDKLETVEEDVKQSVEERFADKQWVRNIESVERDDRTIKVELDQDYASTAQDFDDLCNAVVDHLRDDAETRVFAVSVEDQNGNEVVKSEPDGTDCAPAD